MEYFFFDIFGWSLIFLGFYYFINIVSDQNKKYEVITNNLFYYDQQYREILELKNKIYVIEQRIKKINK